MIKRASVLKGRDFSPAAKPRQISPALAAEGMLVARNRPSHTRWSQALLLCVLGVIMLGASPQDSSARFGRLGHNMMCVCGCGQILLECNHVGCPDSERMIGELHEQMDGPNGSGADSLILNWFVAKYGATVLAAPIRGGFDNVAWITPLVAGILAIFGTAVVVRMWSDRKRRLAPAGNVNPVAEDELRARIRRETEY